MSISERAALYDERNMQHGRRQHRAEQERGRTPGTAAKCYYANWRVKESSMPIYRIEDHQIVQRERTTFARQGLRERDNLQSLLKLNIAVICPETLVVAEEFGDWEDRRRRIDLLAIDQNANLVVIELKRTEDGGHMELQAVRYAASDV